MHAFMAILALFNLPTQCAYESNHNPRRWQAVIRADFSYFAARQDRMRRHPHKEF
jgi:hypothetical protein